ncbi:hypothetical protein JCM9279_001960 [Rhodotorula babjevae]
MASAPESASAPATWTVKECFEAARLIQRKLRRIYNEKLGPNKVAAADKFVLAGLAALKPCRLEDGHPLSAMFETIRFPRELSPIIFHIPPWIEDHAGWQSILDSDEFKESSVTFLKPVNGWEIHRCARTVHYGHGGPYGAVENWEAIVADQLRFGSSWLSADQHDARFATLTIARWALEAGSHDLTVIRGRPGEFQSVHEALLFAVKQVLDDDGERRQLRQVWAAYLSPAELRRAAQWEHALPRSGPAADLGQLVTAWEIFGGHILQLIQSTQRSLAKSAYEPVSRLEAGRASSFM